MAESLWRGFVGATGEEDPTVAATVVTLTLPTGFNQANGRAVIQVRTAAILFTLNGVDPTATDYTTGSEVRSGSSLTVYGSEMGALKMIRATATSAEVHVRYETRVA